MRGRIKVYFKSNNSLVVTINFQSQMEKQILSSELKGNEMGWGGTGTKPKETTVLTNSPASHKPSENKFISLQNNLNQVFSLHKQILPLFLEALIKMC